MEFVNKQKNYWKYVPLVLLLGFIVIARLKLIFSYSLDLDSAEYTYVHLVQRLLQGHDLYSNPTQFPFVALVYTPLYFYGYYFVCKLLHLHPITNLHDIYIAGRVLSFAFFVLQINILYKALKKYNLSAFNSLLAITLFTVLITGGFFVAKMDGVKIFFFTLFLLLIIDYFFYSKTFRSGVFSIIAAGIAISIKQDALIYTAISLGILLLLKPNKKTLLYCLSFALFVCTLFFSYYLIFGPDFFTNIILFNLQVITDFSIGSMTMIVILFSFARTLPLFILCLLNVVWIYKSKKWSSPETFVTALAVLFFGFAHIAMLRPGAYLNYSYEAIVLLTLSFAILLKRKPDLLQSNPHIKIAVLGMYMAGLFATNNYIPNAAAIEREKRYKTTFTTCSAESKIIDSIIGQSVVFFPNPTCAPFFGDRNILYGYDYHANRYINLLVGMKIKSRLLYFESSEYDSYFLNGTAKYIICENTEPQKKAVKTYYPRYRLCKKLQHLSVYEYR